MTPPTGQVGIATTSRLVGYPGAVLNGDEVVVRGWYTLESRTSFLFMEIAVKQGLHPLECVVVVDPGGGIHSLWSHPGMLHLEVRW